MHNTDELKEMLCMELDKIADRGELTPQTLDMVEKLSHSVKSLMKIQEMEEGYSEEGYGERGYGERGSYGSYGSYARGRGRNARRDSMGRYSSEGRNSYEYGR